MPRFISKDNINKVFTATNISFFRKYKIIDIIVSKPPNNTIDFCNIKLAGSPV
ncbi:hypothetical protein [Clostridium carnis]